MNNINVWEGFRMKLFLVPVGCSINWKAQDPNRKILKLRGKIWSIKSRWLISRSIKCLESSPTKRILFGLRVSILTQPSNRRPISSGLMPPIIYLGSIILLKKIKIRLWMKLAVKIPIATAISIPKRRISSMKMTPNTTRNSDIFLKTNLLI